MTRGGVVDLADDPTWFKDAVIYELHVKTFFDSSGDGVGDFPGLIRKLDYLSDLGVTAVWILPFYPSPLRDDGYDIADYNQVNPTLGTLRDVRTLIREAHRRGLRVITELVCNHTSDQHPWFQRARRARRGSVHRDYYVWSDDPARYHEARIIFKDFEPSNWTWDAVAGQYYWHRFFHHQPDLNFDSPQVQREVMHALDFWLEMGIDGLRLDAIPYLFEREGTTCENLPETHQFLKRLRAHVDSRFRNRMLLAEANQWPEDAVAYLEDECHMAFHFPVMPRLFMSLRMEDRFPIVDIMAQTPPIPENAQWAVFLRNHDELTLEMVTDEERDYMYRNYSEDPVARINLGIRRRLAPLLNNNRRRVELMNGLLFSLPGTPVVYYGDEIGMGDNIYLGDRDGVRTPMQWSGDRNAGFSTANRQKLYLPVIVDPEYHYEAVNVEAQQANSQSLLNWMKRLIALRRRHPAFGRGTIEFIEPSNRKVLAFVRRHGDEVIVVVANLSRFVQCADLDLSPFTGLDLVEMFGRTRFPSPTADPYFMTLGPHSFYWFTVERRPVAPDETGVPPRPVRLSVDGGPDAVFAPSFSRRLSDALRLFLPTQRWFGGKARQIESLSVVDRVPVPFAGRTVQLLEALIRYSEGDPDTYLVAAACVPAPEFEPDGRPEIARIGSPAGDMVLYEAMGEGTLHGALLEGIARRRRLRGEVGILTGGATRAFRQLRGPLHEMLISGLSRAEQSNTSIVFGDRMMLKLYRRLELGTNPDLEMGRFLTERTAFRNIAPVAGWLDLGGPGRSYTAGILQGFVPNQGDAWRYTLESLDDFFEAVAATAAPEGVAHRTAEAAAPYLISAGLLGRRTAELHLALASDPDDPDFAPVPSTMLDQRSTYQSVRALAVQVFQLLRALAPTLSEPGREAAERVLAREGTVQSRMRRLLGRPLTAARIRTHGDYHLGQVLYTGTDFVIIDFEGEPARSLQERRLKRWPLRDVAGMLRSLHYAAQSALAAQPAERRASLERWAVEWQQAAQSAFLDAYLGAAAGAPFIPATAEQRTVLLEIFLLEKALYEVRYELNNRPGWVGIPLQGVLELLDGEA